MYMVFRYMSIVQARNHDFGKNGFSEDLPHQPRATKELGERNAFNDPCCE